MVHHELIIDAVVFLSVFTAFLVIVFHKNFNSIEKYFGYYILINALFELIAITMNKLNIENNLPGLHLYTLMEFISISIFFYYAFKRFNFYWPAKLIVGIGSALIIFNSIFIQSIFVYNSYSKSLVELYCIALSIIFYVLLLRSNYKIEDLRPTIFFVAGVLLSSAISCSFYLFSNKILNMPSTLRETLWMMNIISNLIIQVVIIAGIFFINKRVGYTIKQ